MVQVHYFSASDHARDDQFLECQGYPKCFLIAFIDVELTVIKIENATVFDQGLQLFGRGQVYFVNQVLSSQAVVFVS